MPSVVERVRARGLPPPAGISYALNTPDWSLVTRIERSSGEKEAPNMAVVFMNCSIVYWRTDRAGRALCAAAVRSEEHTSELQSLAYLVCRLLLEKKKKKNREFSV